MRTLIMKCIEKGEEKRTTTPWLKTSMQPIHASEETVIRLGLPNHTNLSTFHLKSASVV